MLSLLLDALGTGLLWKNFQEEEATVSPQSIDFITPDTVLSPDTLYIGVLADLSALPPCPQGDAVLVFLADCTCAPPPASSFRLIGTAYPLLRLYQVINQVFCRVRQWERQWGAAILQGDTVPELLNRMALLSDARIFLTDTVGHTLARGLRPALEGDLSPVIDTVHFQVPVRLSPESLGTLHMYAQAELPLWKKTLLKRSVPFVEALLLSDREQPLQDSRLFDALFADLMNGRIESQNIFDQRIEGIVSPPAPGEAGLRYFHLLLVELPLSITESEEECRHVLSELQNLLPAGHFTLFEKRIAGLFVTREFTHLHEAEFHMLHPLLEKYGAYGAVTGLCTRYFLIKTLYTMAIQAIRVGKVLYAGDGTHLFFPKDDYTDYMMIDLLRRAFRSIYKHDEIGYYITFPIMSLFRYDRQHKSNLRKILFRYIMADCSITKAAAELGLHKNTVANKIRKIEELFQLDLSDRRTQFDLLLSYKVLHYFELCAKMPIHSRPTDIPGDAFIV